MQDEINEKTIALYIKTGKLTAQTLQKAMKTLLAQMKKQKDNYARGQHLTNIRHYIDDDESGRFFDRSAYSRMIEDVESGKIGVCIMKDLTRWGRDYLQVGNAMEIFRRNNVRFIAVNNGIDSENPDTLEFAPFINIMSEWYAKDISKKVKTGIKTKGMSGKDNFVDKGMCADFAIISCVCRICS